jgi:hypothetical protein
LSRPQCRSLFRFDRMDDGFEPMALLGDDVAVLDPLFLQPGFERLTGRLINARPRFRIGAIGALKGISDCSLKSAHIKSFCVGRALDLPARRG